MAGPTSLLISRYLEGLKALDEMKREPTKSEKKISSIPQPSQTKLVISKLYWQMNAFTNHFSVSFLETKKERDRKIYIQKR